MIDIDYTKKGVLVYGSPRSGSHLACDMLYGYSTATNKFLKGEITANQLSRESIQNLLTNLSDQYSDKFVFASIVQLRIKNFLSQQPELLKHYQLVHLRRRDKVKQYISWCVFRSQDKLGVWNHSPIWKDILPYLPYEVTGDDLEQFILEQNIDYAFPKPDNVIYYEDLIQMQLETNVKKNIYELPPERLVSDYQLVIDTLEDFKYHD
jgi:LPS sulfotransferase NodH